MFSRLFLPLLFFANAPASKAEECVKGVKLPEAFDGSDWPAIYRLTSPDPEDPMKGNFDLSTTVDPSVLAKAGIRYEYIDPAGFDYPNATAEVPWVPSDGGNNDAYVQEVRDNNDYQYADIIVVTSFIPGFWDEHLHEATTIRYMVDGTGYFDLRDVNDEWVRIPVSAGDWFEWPAGIEHRFSVDEKAYIQAMRLYKGSASPEWSAVPRSAVAGNNTARNAYVDTYLCGEDPDVSSVIPVEEVEIPVEEVEIASPSEDEAPSSASHNGVGLVVGVAALVVALL